jgi:hypothetical protein
MLANPVIRVIVELVNKDWDLLLSLLHAVPHRF